MVHGLLWIVGTYALGALAVHTARRARQRTEANTWHYVLYTLNDGRHIEWAVLSLVMFYWLKGQPLFITIIDEGSTDDTMDIARTLSRRHLLHIHGTSDGDDTSIKGNTSVDNDPSIADISGNNTRFIHIRLHHPEDWQKLPLGYSTQ